MFKEVFFDVIIIIIIIIIIIFIIIIITIIIIIDIIIDCTIPVSLITKNALAWLIAIGGTPNWGSEGSFLSGLDSIPFILFSLFSFPLSSLLSFLSLLLSWFVLSPCSWCEWNPNSYWRRCESIWLLSFILFLSGIGDFLRESDGRNYYNICFNESKDSII